MLITSLEKATFYLEQSRSPFPILYGCQPDALSYLSYKGWLDVKWIPIENSAKSTLTDITNRAIHALNNTASHFQVQPSAIGSVGLPIAAAFGFMPGLIFGLRRG